MCTARGDDRRTTQSFFNSPSTMGGLCPLVRCRIEAVLNTAAGLNTGLRLDTSPYSGQVLPEVDPDSPPSCVLSSSKGFLSVSDHLTCHPIGPCVCRRRAFRARKTSCHWIPVMSSCLGNNLLCGEFFPTSCETWKLAQQERQKDSV